MAKTKITELKTSPADNVEVMGGSEPSSEKVQELERLVALLMVALARSDEHIEKTEEILQQAGEYFHVRTTAALELLMGSIAGLDEPPDVKCLLRKWRTELSAKDKEDIALMMLDIVASDGKRDAQEMAMLHKAADMINVSPESLHAAFNRFFAQADKA